MYKLSVVVLLVTLCLALGLPTPDDDKPQSSEGFAGSISKTFQDAASKTADTFHNIGQDSQDAFKSIADGFEKQVNNARDQVKDFFNKFGS